MILENGKIIIMFLIFIAIIITAIIFINNNNNDISINWVAGGNGNITSNNGTNWEFSITPINSVNVKSINYGTSDGFSPLFVAGSVGNDNIWYSETGTSWYVGSGDLFNDNSCDGVAYGTSNGVSPLWVAVGKDTDNNNIVYSENGKVWTNANNGDIFPYGSAVAYGTSNGTSLLWVAGGTSIIIYSENGKDWNLALESVITNDIAKIVYGVCRTNTDLPFWVAVGLSSIWYSENGKAWYNTNYKYPGEELLDIDYGDGLWLAVGTSSSFPIIHSNNGLTWGSSLININNDGTGALSVAYGNNSWMAGVGLSMFYSYNGYDWTKAGGDYLSNGTNSIVYKKL
jgi:hypothetical protein